MILVAGGSGTLGTLVVRRLVAAGLPTRVLARHPERMDAALAAQVEIFSGDVRNSGDVAQAMHGVRTVVSAISGFGPRGDGPEAIDHLGNGNLVRAALNAGVEHVILVSIVNASPEHPLGLNRAKYRAEQDLRASGLAWTIIRPTVLMETWLALVGEPLARTGKATIFGRGDNPVNFVSAADIAALVELAVVDPTLRGAALDAGGPEDLTLNQFVGVIASETGMAARVAHVPRPALHVLGALAGALHHPLGRMAAAALAMDTQPMAFNSPDVWRRYTQREPTPLRDLVRAVLASRDERTAQHVPTPASNSPRMSR